MNMETGNLQKGLDNDLLFELSSNRRSMRSRMKKIFLRMVRLATAVFTGAITGTAVVQASRVN